MQKKSAENKSSEKLVSIDGYSLTLDQIEAVARNHVNAELASNARIQVQDCANTILDIANSEHPVYGVNTGFGIFASQRIAPEETVRLSRNLILSHLVGVGAPFEKDIVRAAILIRANTFAHGNSGVRPQLIDTLLDMLRYDVTPYIPSRGSLGASGDLAPLAHLASVISAPLEDDQEDYSGQAWFRDQLMSGAEAMAAANLARIMLGPKEGLAITNGATFSTATLALACIDAERVLRCAEIAAALSLEALLGVSGAFDPRLHDARPHPGQIMVASRIRELTNESDLLDADDRVHDAYSLRCIPQILGPVWDILSFVKMVVTTEVNAATDNPLLFDEQAISGGNFHGEPIGLAADYLKIALSKVGSLSERRIFRLTAEHTNAGLPPMLVAHKEKAGILSGLMMLQYTAASLTLENQALAMPDTLHSIPTSAGQEDINPNATTAVHHLSELMDNLWKIVAIELIVAAQALDLRLLAMPQANSGVGTSAAYKYVRQHLPFREVDSPYSEDIEALSEILRAGDLTREVESALGGL
ncbi:MAG: aromatic amino acid lyase [Anaerolineaceae bacterium]|nr:MAG: aromatic amino acid lyase [Anaerolineaceae bacterium]